jgi:cytochrome P450
MEYFDPHSTNWLLNKFNIYKDLRARDTAYWSEKYQMYVITRYDDVLFALNNPEIFSSAKGNLIVENTTRFGVTLGASDNPTHDAYKNIVKDAYSKDNIERILAHFTQVAEQALSNKTTLNISDIIDELSAETIAECINLPHDKAIVKDLIVHIQRHAPLAVSENVDGSGFAKLNRIISTLALITKVKSPGPGIYHEFINNNPNKLNVLSLFFGPTLSGASSLTGGLQFLTLDLFRENQLDELLTNPSLIPNAVNESLRFHASTGRFSRTVIQPTTLHGVNLKPGDRVALCLESANRDPAKFPDPDVFDLHRNTSGQLAFGYGLHACIALAITKAVMVKYLELLLDIVGRYRVITPISEYKYVMTASGNDDMISNIIIEKV